MARGWTSLPVSLADLVDRQSGRLPRRALFEALPPAPGEHDGLLVSVLARARQAVGRALQALAATRDRAKVILGRALADVVGEGDLATPSRKMLSSRLEQNLAKHDVQGERAIAFAQGIICCFVLGLHCLAKFKSGLASVNPWVVLTLSALIASSSLRLYLVRAEKPPTRALDVMNVVDIAIFLVLIWSYQFAYDHPAGGVLKAPSFALLLALVALRALKSHPRPILIAGATAVAGWVLLVCLAVASDGSGSITHDYTEFLSSHRILVGAEFERVVGLLAMVCFLAAATHQARAILGQAAHASDYAEALDAAESHLKAATLAKEKAEATLAELDRRDALLSEQNRRFNAALANMSPGLCMFDADGRLLVCNDRYAEIYRLPPSLVAPGTPYLEILEHRIAAGAYTGGKPEDYVEERLASVRETEPSIKFHELVDGRVIAIRHQPMGDGCWVATHEDITQLRRVEARLSHMARHDSLTNLPNRQHLREAMEDALYGAGGEARPLVLLIIELERFKEINDSLGHSTGDRLLHAIAERLSANFSDADVIARVGGDEFAVMHRTDDPSDAAVQLAERVLEALSDPFDIDGYPIVVGSSIGIATGPADGNDPEQLFKSADLALDRAKSSGRGTYSFFEREMDERMQVRRELEQDLRSAIANDEFELYYQPQLNLARNQISGCEALIRWHHPVRGRISPAEFIPIAEETGLIVEIGEWALKRACLDAAGWRSGIKVAVNVSAVQLRTGDVLGNVIDALAVTGLAPQRLELEVTESVMLDESANVLATLQRLHDIGVRISLDDFGTGYSSLGYLKRFPFDKIKIDKSFVTELTGKDDNSCAIVRTVAALGASLGIATTAEGVETAEQLQRVRKEGYTEIQGYFLSPPVPLLELMRLFEREMPRAIFVA
jgi:diguanylate cyclase (GGDEF)-like protein